MESIIQEIAQKTSISFEKELENLMTKRQDISKFILGISKTLNETGASLVAEALETMDYLYRESEVRKQNWVIKSKNDSKTLATIFGEVKYKRTYYQNKKSGKYCYLSNEVLGIMSHDNLDASLKAKLIEKAVFMPYAHSGEKANEHVALQNGGREEPKLVYVHESREKIGENRWKLLKRLVVYVNYVLK